MAERIDILVDAILAERTDEVVQLLKQGIDINQMDIYGFTPLIEAAIVENTEIATLLLQHGANVNISDSNGQTALHWAIDNNNTALAEKLIKQGANPNAYSLASQPTLVKPLLREQKPMKNLLYQSGADLNFAQDYINAKSIGHRFELIGITDIVDSYGRFTELDFEGFYLEFTLAMIRHSLKSYSNHFVARHYQQYLRHIKAILKALDTAAHLANLMPYNVDRNLHQERIKKMFASPLLLIPVAFEGHAITFVRFGNLWGMCDRREYGDGIDNVNIYQMENPQNCNERLLTQLIFNKNDTNFIRHELSDYLGLKKITELEQIPKQITGNCSWANVEASVPLLLLLLLASDPSSESSLKELKDTAITYYNDWRNWDKDNTLYLCIKNIREASEARKASKAEILASILFQNADASNPDKVRRGKNILRQIGKAPFSYLIENYMKTFREDFESEPAQNFKQFLEACDYYLD